MYPLRDLAMGAADFSSDDVGHFHHPTWRDDPNDPATATRVNEQKVRFLPE